MFETFGAILLLGWFSWRFMDAQHANQRELGRFNANAALQNNSFEKKVDEIFQSLGRRLALKKDLKRQAKLSEKDAANRLRAAGLESESDRGRYVLVLIISYLSWPVISVLAWSNFEPYYATVTMMFSFAFVVIAPILWLKRRTLGRTEEIQRELPLVIDLTNLATSAGWDVSSALEKVIDALAPEFPRHPLINEMKHARWLATSGYTWGEALERVSKKVGDDTVTRVTLALAQALEQGGDRSAQLAGIAADAQRTYYSTLDRRLAAVPVKALVITLVLFLTYFAVLLAPAAVGVGDSIGL